MMQEKKLGLPSIVATGVGLIIATSCLLSIGQGASAIGLPFIITMAIACAFNILTAFSICELNALMPNLTGGMAQYTLACFGPFVSIVITVGGYLTCQTIMGSSEAAMFGNTLSSVLPNVPIPGSVYSIVLILLLLGLNLFGVDMFAKVQNIVAYGLIGSLLFLGIMGTIKLGTGQVVEQPEVLSSKPGDVFSLLGLAFFLFIGVEFIVPISTQVKNPRRKVPLGMVISLLAILLMQIFMVVGFQPLYAVGGTERQHCPSYSVRYPAVWQSRYDLDDHHLSSGSGQHPEHRYVLYRSDLFRYGKAEAAARCVHAQESAWHTLCRAAAGGNRNDSYQHYRTFHQRSADVPDSDGLHVLDLLLHHSALRCADSAEAPAESPQNI